MNRKKTFETSHKRIYILAFALILLLLLIMFDYYSCKMPLMGYINKLTVTSGSRFGSAEIEPSIYALQTPNDSSKLLLGDSVAFQLFSPFMNTKEDFMVYPTNASLTTAGQYVLARIFLENHPKATDIYLVLRPSSLAADIDSSMSYQYIAMPFIENGYSDYLSGLAYEELKNNYGSFFLNPNVIRYIDNSGVNRKLYFNSLNTQKSQNVATNNEDKYISDLSIYYLKKLYSLGQEYGVSVHLISDPVADIELHQVQKEGIQKAFDENELTSLYPNYCDSIFFCPEDYYLSDQIHFNDEHHNRETLNPLIDKMSGLDMSVYGLSQLLD